MEEKSGGEHLEENIWRRTPESEYSRDSYDKSWPGDLGSFAFDIIFSMLPACPVWPS